MFAASNSGATKPCFLHWLNMMPVWRQSIGAGDITEDVGKEGRHVAGFFGHLARRRHVMRCQSRSSWPMQIRPRESMKRTSASLGKTIASDRVRCNRIYARLERLHPSAKTMLRLGHLSVTIRHTAIVAKTSGQATIYQPPSRFMAFRGSTPGIAGASVSIGGKRRRPTVSPTGGSRRYPCQRGKAHLHRTAETICVGGGRYRMKRGACSEHRSVISRGAG